MGSTIQVQILDEDVFVSPLANVLGKDMNHSVLPPTLSNLKDAAYFCFDLTAGQEELKLTSCHVSLGIS